MMDERRKKLLFRSDHRGTKEMDLLLGSFARKYVASFSEEELEEYSRILELSDPDLYNWMTGKEDVPANLNGPVMMQLLAHNFTSCS